MTKFYGVLVLHKYINICMTIEIVCCNCVYLMYININNIYCLLLKFSIKYCKVYYYIKTHIVKINFILMNSFNC